MLDRLDAVFFDLDGTLVDTAPDFLISINKLRLEENLPMLSMKELKPSVSNGALAMLKASFPNQQPEALLEHFLDLYEQSVCIESQLFSGMESILQWLEQSSTPWGVVTNKPWRFTSPLMEQLGLADNCDAIICPDHVNNTKPDPEGLLKACEQTRVQPENCIYIGDHKRDIDAGKNANMATIAAAYGYIEHGASITSWGADFISHHPNEILSHLSQTD